MDLKKYRNKAEIEEHKKAVLHLQSTQQTYRVVFLDSFISALFLYLVRPSLLEIRIAERFPSFCFRLFRGFLNQLPNKNECVDCARDKCISCWRRTHFELEMNTIVLETNAL